MGIITTKLTQILFLDNKILKMSSIWILILYSDTDALGGHFGYTGARFCFAEVKSKNLQHLPNYRQYLESARDISPQNLF